MRLTLPPFAALPAHREQRIEVATAAAAEVGLEEKLGAAAGALSGGQRRKLSVALAFVGDPSGGWQLDGRHQLLGWSVKFHESPACWWPLQLHGLAVLECGRLSHKCFLLFSSGHPGRALQWHGPIHPAVRGGNSLCCMQPAVGGRLAGRFSPLSMAGLSPRFSAC